MVAPNPPGFEPEYPARLVGPAEFSGPDVPVPVPQMRDALRPGQTLLAALQGVLRLHRVDDLTEGAKQRSEVGDELLIVPLRAVRQAHHADQISIPHDRQAEKRVERRVLLRQPSAAGVVGRIVGDHGLLRRHHRPVERVQVRQLHTPRGMPFVQPSALFVPGDVGQGRQSRIRRAVGLGEHLGDQPVLARGQRQHPTQYVLEKFPAVSLGDESLVQGDDDLVEVSMAPERGLRPLALGDVGQRDKDARKRVFVSGWDRPPQHHVPPAAVERDKLLLQVGEADAVAELHNLLRETLIGVGPV